MSPTRTALVALAAGVAVLVAGAAAMIYAQARTPRPANAAMVALGSSYAAGPGLGDMAPGSLFLCVQTAGNYPHRVARARGMILADATCSGATAAQVLGGGQYWLPSQLAALNPATQLVTVTAGGNDVFFIGNLTSWACANHPEAMSWTRRLLFCGTPHSSREVDAALVRLGGRLSALFDAIHAHAPHARILAVNYLTLLPPVGTCVRLALTRAQADDGRRIAAALATTTAAAAQRHGAELVDAAAASRGHDACSASPWVQGFVPQGGGGVAFHPDVAGTSAVVRLVLAALSRPARR